MRHHEPRPQHIRVHAGTPTVGVLIKVKLTSKPCSAAWVKHSVKWTVSPLYFCPVRIAPFALYDAETVSKIKEVES